jgi:uncharacterized repeat protein (TIGR02543 family)
MGALLFTVGGSGDTLDFAADTATVRGAAPAGQSVAVGGGSIALGQGPTEVVTSDQSFRSVRDGFSFANWAGAPAADLIDASTMSALFTKEAVCVDPSAGLCVMLPAAQKIADQMNAAIAAGRCEGMSVLSQRFFDNLDPRADGVIETAMIGQGSVAKQLGYWWATQVAPPVAQESKKFRAMTPSKLVAALEKGLMAPTKAGFTLGMYSKEGGHSVTPVAVTNDGKNKVIYVYDNNYPNEQRKIVVDPAKETWTYVGAGLNSSAAIGTWTGKGKGTLDLTPMASRQGPFKVSFGSTRGLKAQAYSVLVTQNSSSNAPVGVKINTRIGGKNIAVNTLDPLSVADAPFAVRSLVGGIAGQGSISYVPVVLGETGKLTMEVIADESAGPVTLSILRTGTSSVVIESASDFKVELTTEAFSTDVEVTLPTPTSTANVQLANGPRAAELALTAGQGVGFTTKFQDDDAAPDAGTRRIEDPLPEFEVRSHKGEVLYKGSLAGAIDEGTALIQQISFNAAKGVFEVVEVSPQAQVLDMKFVEQLQPTTEPKYDTVTTPPDAETVENKKPKEECDPSDFFGECFEGFRAVAPPTTTTTVPDDDDDLDLDNFLGTAPTTTVAPSAPVTTVAPTTTTTVAPTTTTTVAPTTTTTVAPPKEFELDVSLAAEVDDATYDRTVSWTLDKSVNQDTFAGEAGDSFDFTWTLTSTRTYENSNYSASGKLTFTNTSSASVTVSSVLGEKNADGDSFFVNCGDNAVPANGTLECRFSASVASDVEELSFTALGSYVIPTGFSGAGTPVTNVALGPVTASVGFVPNPLIGSETARLVDDAYAGADFESVDKDLTGSDETRLPDSYQCSSNTNLYTNGRYPISFTNTATLTAGSATETDSASVTITCTLEVEDPREPNDDQPATPTNNNPDSWGDGCEKIDSYSGMTWRAPASYKGVVLKAANTDFIFIGVSASELLGVTGGNSISHIIYCTGSFNGTGTSPAPTPTLYTVSFEKGINGNVTNMPASQSCEAIGDASCTVTLSAGVPMRTGYTFKGWTAGGATYMPSATVPLTSNLTLTATWTQNS